MKVLLLNGSPHPKGCTFTALSEVASSLNDDGIDTEIFQIGVRAVSGCIACNRCRETGKCVINDLVNVFIEKASKCDGFVFGSPVHYASASGMIRSFLDRVFYAGSRNLAYKPGAAVVSCRRAGSTAALDQLNKYMTINNMPIVSSQYWNMVHGSVPEQVYQDEEGMQTMRILGRNMAWLLSCIQAGKDKGIEPVRDEQRTYTNFIR